MNNELTEAKSWRGTFMDLPFQIKHWGVGKEYMNGGRGTWNYYVYIPERLTSRFAELWLEPKVTKIVETSPGFVMHDYWNTFVAGVDWHGGVTYYAKHGEVEGFRSVEFGCDYNHLWDQGQEYLLENVLAEVQETIRQIVPLLTQSSTP